MSEKPGTPQSLSQAVKNGNPALNEAEVEQVCRHVQDYLAQKFCAAIFQNVSDEVNFRQLFLKCIKRIKE